MCVRVCTFFPAHHLVSVPEQIQASAIDGGADEVQAVVSNSEIQVSKAEHNPVFEREGTSLYLLQQPPLHVFPQCVCVCLHTCTTIFLSLSFRPW